METLDKVSQGVEMLSSVLLMTKPPDDTVKKDLAEIKQQLGQVMEGLGTLSNNFDNFIKELDFRVDKNALNVYFDEINTGMDNLNEGQLSLLAQSCKDYGKAVTTILNRSNGGFGITSLFDSLFKGTDGDPRAVLEWSKIIFTYSAFGLTLLDTCKAMNQSVNDPETIRTGKMKTLLKKITETLTKCDTDLKKYVNDFVKRKTDPDIEKVLKNLEKNKRWVNFAVFRLPSNDNCPFGLAKYCPLLNYTKIDSLYMGYDSSFVTKTAIFYIEKSALSNSFTEKDVLMNLQGLNSLELPNSFLSISTCVDTTGGQRILLPKPPKIYSISSEKMDSALAKIVASDLPQLFSVVSFGNNFMEVAISKGLGYHGNAVDVNAPKKQKCALKYVSILNPLAIKDRQEVLIFDGPYGEWGPKYQCDMVTGFETKVEKAKHSLGDDAALAAIKMSCQDQQTLMSPAWVDGSWERKKSCPDGYTGAMVRIEKQLVEDMTGVNNIRLFCSMADDQVQESGSQNWGEWSEKKSCSGTKKICGAYFKFEPSNNKDNKALTGIAFICC